MKKILAVVLAALMLFTLAACGGAKTNTDATNTDAAKVTNISVGTGGPTGTYYAYTGAVCQAIATDDIKLTYISTGGSQANIERIRDGIDQMAIVQNDVMNYAYAGTNGFDTAITDFSAVGCVYAEVCQLVATKSSGIKTVADLKGKTVAVGDAGSGVYYNAEQILAAAGIDIDEDINKVTASFGESATQLKDGSIQAAFITAGTPTTAITELATSTEVVLVDLGADVISKLMDEYTFYSEYTATSADYAFVTEDTKTVAIQATYVVSNELSEDVVYELTKNLWEKKDSISHAKAGEMDINKATTGVGNVPLHPGAAKYYKEAGIIAE